MVLLKKQIHSLCKMAVYYVGVQINNSPEELCEMYFSTNRSLKSLVMEFENRNHLFIYVKDMTLMNNDSVDCVTLKNEMITAEQLIIIRFSSARDLQNFLHEGFPDSDSGQSSVSESSSSTPSPPPIN